MINRDRQNINTRIALSRGFIHEGDLDAQVVAASLDAALALRAEGQFLAPPACGVRRGNDVTALDQLKGGGGGGGKVNFKWKPC